MKCKNCSAELEDIGGGKYRCQYCGSTYVLKQKVTSSNESNFLIVAGEVRRYAGADEIVTIPDGVTSIGKSVFTGNKIIKKVIFSNTVAVIEDKAFEGCSQLASIENYANVKTYGNDCFRESGLKQLDIGENVVSIGKNAFSYMPELTGLNFHPGKILKLDKAFVRSPKLANIKMDKLYFFPLLCVSFEVKNNPNRDRPTYADAFAGTPFFKTISNELMNAYKTGVCPDCGGRIKKGLLHAKCVNCGIDYKSVTF